METVITSNRVRTWAWVGLSAQLVFVLGWLVAPAWQSTGYSVLRHSISDMYAVTAPHGWVLVVLLTLCGAATIIFAWFCVRPTLAPAGRRATVGVVLLSLSVYGLGDLLSVSERLACQRADLTCSAADQVENVGGTLDGLLTSFGVLMLSAAGFVLASAMARLPAWAGRARWARLLTLVFIVAFLATGFLGDTIGLGGLLERLIAVVGAAGLALLALAVLRQAPDGSRLRTVGQQEQGDSAQL